MFSVTSLTCLRLSVTGVIVICCVAYLQFSIQAWFSSTSVSQAAQRRTRFTQYCKYDVAQKFGEVFCTEHTFQVNDFELISMVEMETIDIPYRDHFVVNLRHQRGVMDPRSRKTLTVSEVFHHES